MTKSRLFSKEDSDKELERGREFLDRLFGIKKACDGVPHPENLDKLLLAAREIVLEWREWSSPDAPQGPEFPWEAWQKIASLDAALREMGIEVEPLEERSGS